MHAGSHGQSTTFPQDCLNLCFNQQAAAELALHIALQLLLHAGTWYTMLPSSGTQPELPHFKGDK